MIKQRTIKTLTRAVGVGLHSGQRVEITLRPAQPDTGIVFRRIDLPQPVDIAVSALTVTDTRMASTISNGNAKVHTVEHLMSACAVLGVDNLHVDITAEEVPILDGSAASFVFLLQSAGIELQNAPRRFIRLLKTVTVRQGEGATNQADTADDDFPQVCHQPCSAFSRASRKREFSFGKPVVTRMNPGMATGRTMTP